MTSTSQIDILWTLGKSENFGSSAILIISLAACRTAQRRLNVYSVHVINVCEQDIPKLIS